MTVEQWLLETLAGKISDDVIMVADDVGVDVSIFTQIFGAAISHELAKETSARDFFAALSGAHSFEWEGSWLTMTAEELGYQIYFDAWRAQGLI